MSKSKVRLSEVDELSDAGALEHSRGKYARLRQAGDGDSKEGEGSSRDEVPKEYESKHTLDSDEEEDMKYTKLDVEEVEGQEEATEEEFEGSTKIMAFNMQEDLEEGHFDTSGNFIFNKKEDEIKDAWLDNIDWTKVKTNAGEQWHQKNEEDSSTAINFGDSELKSVYERIAAMLKPNETIEHALSRLGKEKGLSAAEERKRRWAAKKAGREYVDEGAAAMKELTGLADSLVSNGELEAYQYTLEKLLFLIKELQSKAVDVLDMFSDAAPVIQKAENTGQVEEEKAAGKSSSDVVFWEYKLSNEDGAEIFGPFTSEQMLEMQQEGKFENGGWARKQGAQSFYTVARIDFEIYT